eukprot:TRINITY_DN1263_c0_g1_i3.p1 TRINITY_DN1263_c0_g1~~TRINITY_DN1263_c0_g1_i3.p1  ORF type:complete len:797 (+),score=188.92 TRINITY_DN1263_c0_g1_i3:61-2391(+)
MNGDKAVESNLRAQLAALSLTPTYTLSPKQLKSAWSPALGGTPHVPARSASSASLPVPKSLSLESAPLVASAPGAASPITAMAVASSAPAAPSPLSQLLQAQAAKAAPAKASFRTFTPPPPSSQTTLNQAQSVPLVVPQIQISSPSQQQAAASPQLSPTTAARPMSPASPRPASPAPAPALAPSSALHPGCSPSLPLSTVRTISSPSTPPASPQMNPPSATSHAYVSSQSPQAGESPLVARHYYVIPERRLCEEWQSLGVELVHHMVEIPGFRLYAAEQWIFKHSHPWTVVKMAPPEYKVVGAVVRLNPKIPSHQFLMERFFRGPSTSSDFKLVTTRYGHILVYEPEADTPQLKLIKVRSGNFVRESGSLRLLVALKRLSCCTHIKLSRFPKAESRFWSLYGGSLRNLVQPHTEGDPAAIDAADASAAAEPAPSPTLQPAQLILPDSAQSLPRALEVLVRLGANNEGGAACDDNEGTELHAKACIREVVAQAQHALVVLQALRPAEEDKITPGEFCLATAQALQVFQESCASATGGEVENRGLLTPELLVKLLEYSNRVIAALVYVGFKMPDLLEFHSSPVAYAEAFNSIEEGAGFVSCADVVKFLTKGDDTGLTALFDKGALSQQQLQRGRHNMHRRAFSSAEAAQQEQAALMAQQQEQHQQDAQQRQLATPSPDATALARLPEGSRELVTLLLQAHSSTQRLQTEVSYRCCCCCYVHARCSFRSPAIYLTIGAAHGTRDARAGIGLRATATDVPAATAGVLGAQGRRRVANASG